MIKKEWQRLIHNPLLIVVLMAIILIPSIYAGFFLASMWDPYGELDKLPVAVVNKDVPVYYEDEKIDIGGELIKNLQKDGSLDFHFVDDATAHKGLKDGSYYMVITIPENFSHNATTVMDDSPAKMDLQYETDPATNYIAMKLSESAMTKIQLSLERKVTETYTQTLFGKLNTLSDSLSEASTGASDIHDGTTSVKEGADTLSEGTSALLTGAQTLSTGADSLKDGAATLDEGLISYMDGTNAIDKGAGDLYTGADALATGTKSLSDGADALSTGAKDLSDGVTAIKDGATDLSTGADTLAAGASAVATGASDLNEGLSTLNTSMPLVGSAIGTLDTGASDLSDSIKTYTEAVDTVSSSASTLSDGLSSLDTALSGEEGLKASSAVYKENISALAETASGLAEAGAIPQELSDSINALSEGYTAIDTAIGGENGICAGVSALSGGASQLSDGLVLIVGEENANSTALRDGAASISTGLTALDTSATDLSTGISTLAQGASDLKDGTSTLSTGASDLKDGASALKTGAETAATGASDLKDGASDLATGSLTLSNGASDLKDGAKTLSDGADTLVENNQTILDGSTALKDGASSLATGASDLKDGAKDLDDGASTLAESLPDLVDGTKTLYDGLSEGSEKLSDTNKEDVNAMMFSSPLEITETKITNVNDNGHAMAAYMMSVGLWVACLAFCLMYPLTEHDKMESGFKWWLSKASVIYPMAILQAVILVMILHFTLGFEPARLGQTIFVACLTSVAFMSIMYFFNVCIGKVGSFVMLIFMVLQLAGSAGTYPIEVSGPLAAALNKFMPFTYTVSAFRSSIGGGEPFPSSIRVLLALFITFTLLTVILFMVRGKMEEKGKSNLYDKMEAHGFA